MKIIHRLSWTFVLWLVIASGIVLAQEWRDNESQKKSDDPTINARRSEHFRIIWGWGEGEGSVGVDFPRVTEQLVQGNLQMLEQCWHLFHDAPPNGFAFHIPDEAIDPAKRDGNLYRDNLVMNNTGIWEGGAWGACDDIGLPLFALPPTYLRFDPPSGATPHEYAHTVLINAAGFNDTPYDGMWHEATANWLQLQFNNSYPGPAGAGLQPYLSLPHGRDYYDCWQMWETIREDPNLGVGFINKLWLEAKGRDKEYIFDAMARLLPDPLPHSSFILHPSSFRDPYNAVKDILGKTAARAVTWDYQRHDFFLALSPRTMDPFSEMYRRAYTELEREAPAEPDQSAPAEPQWYRVPFAHAPMQGGYNIVPIALPEKSGGGYKVTIHFRPLWDPIRHSDFRATLVAVNDQGGPRYSTMWNGGRNSITLSADENQLYLVVCATPDFMPFEGFSRPLMTDLTLQPQSYEVAFIDTKATAYESIPQRPNVAGHAHSNGGGFVADTATVDPTAYVGPDAMVLDRAQVLGQARITDYAVVMGDAIVKDNAQLSGHALVRERAQIYGNGKVRDWATVQGRWEVYENGRALERCYLTDRGKLHGSATIKGNVPDYGGADVSGYAIKEGDCANSANVDHQVLMCWVWGIDQKYADDQPDTTGLYCNYTFDPRVSSSPTPDTPHPTPDSPYAFDRFGLLHGYLRGNPKIVPTRDRIVGSAGLTNVLQLNGKNQYVELKRDVADMIDTTIATWVWWDGSSTDQRIFSFGDGGSRYMHLTPKDAKSGKLQFTITDRGKAGEQKLIGQAALPRRTWTHIAVTLRGDTGTLYVDGKIVATNNAMTLNPDCVLGPNTLAGNDRMFLGQGFRGLIDDFRVYVQPQDDAVISQLGTQIQDRRTGAVSVAVAIDPSPTTPTFTVKPTPIGCTAVTMSTEKLPLDEWTQYRFTCTDPGGHNSGWISTNHWTDCDLQAGKTYTYIVERRNERGDIAAASSPASVTLPEPAPLVAAFEQDPRGISDTAIRMTARKNSDQGYLIEYQFTRDDGKTTGWQASNIWTDSGLTKGEKHTYTVEVRDAYGNVTKAVEDRTSIAQDDTPPATYKIGEWQTRPYADLDNKLVMKAMSVTGGFECPQIEREPVEYYFRCDSGNGPDSGWIDTAMYTTPALPDGVYRYLFKMRDTSPQHNETEWSSIQSVKISNMTGYHPCRFSDIANLPEGVLISTTGAVVDVAADHYVVESDGVRMNVIPATKSKATEPQFKGKDVTIKGCLWIVSGEKQIAWAIIE